MQQFTLQVIDHTAKSVSTYPQVSVANDADVEELREFARSVADIAITFESGRLYVLTDEALDRRVAQIKSVRDDIAGIVNFTSLVRFVRSLGDISPGSYKDYAIIGAE